LKRKNINNTFLNINQPSSCINGYVKFNDDKNVKSFCGSIINTEKFIYTSCANKVTITYVTSNAQNNEYRGFNSYFEGKLK
jgi:hypothetical protein